MIANNEETRSLIKDNLQVNTTLMTPRLIMSMMIMSLLGAVGPIAAMAQDGEEEVITTIDDNDRLLGICEENQRIEQTDIVELTPGLVLSEIEITFEADSEDDPVCDALEGKILKMPVVIRRPPAL